MKNRKWNRQNAQWLAVLLGLLTLLWSCSSSDDDSTPSSSSGLIFTSTDYIPKWEVDWMWHDEIPNWTSPDPTRFEERMYVILKLNEGFCPYSTDADRMAVFVGDECRGVSSRSVNKLNSNDIYFTILVAGNKTDTERMQSLTLAYYCDGMKQIFYYPGFSRFSPDNIMGDTWNMTPPFGGGSPKYTSNRMMLLKLGDDSSFTPSKNDLVGVFIDGQCRGVGKPNQEFNIWLTSDEEKGKEMQVLYYNEEKQGFFTLKEPILITDEYYYEPAI